jgi:hypothetical protein
MPLRDKSLTPTQASAPYKERPVPGSERGDLGLVPGCTWGGEVDPLRFVSSAACCLQYRGKLIQFLKSSSCYKATELRSRLQVTTLFEELVVVYSKLRDHKCALHILINQLSDHGSAEAYCVENFSWEDNPFHVLLEEYLTTSASAPYLKAALDLLESHPTRVDPVHVLEILPSTLPVAQLQKFLLQVSEILGIVVLTTRM